MAKQMIVNPSARKVKATELRALNALNRLCVNNADALTRHKNVIVAARALHAALRAAVKLDDCPL